MERGYRDAAVPARHRIALAVPHSVERVEDEKLRRLHADVLQHSADGLDAPLAAGRCRVDDVEEQRRVGQLFERSAKGDDEVRRQVADEPDGVGDDDLALAREPQAPREVGSKVANIWSATCTSVRVRARNSVLLPAFVIADDGQNRDRAAPPPLPPVLALRGELLQLALEAGEAIPGTPAVDLKLRLAGSPSADAASESRQRDLGALREPRTQVLELRQLHLQIAVARPPRRCRKDGAHGIIQSMSVWIAQRTRGPRTDWLAVQVAPTHPADDTLRHLDAVRGWATARWV